MELPITVTAATHANAMNVRIKVYSASAWPSGARIVARDANIFLPEILFLIANRIG